MVTLIRNIDGLAGVHDPRAPLRGKDLAQFPVIRNAWLLLDGERIAEVGTENSAAPPVGQVDNVIDASRNWILPAWCDSHTHLVFAATREHEFLDKIEGLSYAEIAAKGGGILNSARRLAETPEELLFQSARQRLQEIAATGTASVEIKSGYGLTPEAELKMLRVIRRLKQESPLHIRSTFLAAHAFPAEFRDNHEGYIRQITEEMLPVIRDEKLADYIDVFCETGFFNLEETERICRAGQAIGLTPKLHVNQLSSIGGLQTAVSCGALSADHLEVMTEDDIRTLAGSDTIGTLLPTAAFFLRMAYQPARALVDASCAIALASDYNPGSSPSGNMNFVVSLACIQMRMRPEEALNAATINGAFAMGLGAETGSIATGKSADLLFMRPMSSLALLPYSFGSSLIERVMVRGRFI